MIIYCMSDIHGCLAEFEDALSLVLDDIEQCKAKLVLLGDYIHGGPDNRGVLDRIMKLRERFGSDRIIALLGNHDEWVVNGSSTISNNSVYARIEEWEDESDDDEYINWLSSLPLYYVEGNTIFVHAGIDEEAGDMWEWETSDDIYTSKYPAETGKIDGLDMKVVAGHIYTSEIADNPRFNDIYYDGENHIYIDGNVLTTGNIPVLLVDTDTDSYYHVEDGECWLLEKYEEE